MIFFRRVSQVFVPTVFGHNYAHVYWQFASWFFTRFCITICLMNECINKWYKKHQKQKPKAARQQQHEHAFKMHLFGFNFRFELCMQIVNATCLCLRFWLGLCLWHREGVKSEERGVICYLLFVTRFSSLCRHRHNTERANTWSPFRWETLQSTVWQGGGKK